jgi:hypothetical protein
MRSSRDIVSHEHCGKPFDPPKGEGIEIFATT